MIVPMYPGCVVPQIKFYGLEISAGDLLSVTFWSRDPLGFSLLPDHPCHLSRSIRFLSIFN